VDNERFESKRRPGWILSHSTWRDEKSVVRWRTAAKHHLAQEHGRSEILRDYHLRVGDVTADTGAPEEAPIREQRFDETEIGAAKLATLTEITPQAGAAFGSHADLPSALGLDLSRDGVVEHDVFASIYNPGKFAVLVSWTDAKAANLWTPVRPKGARTLRHRKVRNRAWLTACSIAGSHRNSIPMPRGDKPSIRNPRREAVTSPDAPTNAPLSSYQSIELRCSANCMVFEDSSKTRSVQVRLMSSRPPTRPMTVLAPIAMTNRMISSAYICGMLKML